MTGAPEPFYLGLDLSTQQLKAAVVDNNLQVLHETSVQFDNDLPEFRTYGGYVQKEKGRSWVTSAPTLMWVKALDMILDKLRVCGVDFSKVAAISGCAQQHGTVYWSRGSQKQLQNLNPEKFLHEQLIGSFAVPLSPIWRDCSAEDYCRILEDAAGGPLQLARLTGSRGYARFSGPQIARIAQERPDAYNNTERISLVSSFVASLFIGDHAPIDWADSSGTNLFDIRSKDWCDDLLQVCGSNLREKLGKTVPSYTIVGPISSYFIERFGFNENCKIVAFTGDNPGSLIGLRLKKGDVACSLGTSDTIFFPLREPRTETAGHVFCNPLDTDAYMALICFQNGSLTRERRKDWEAEGSWQLFNELLDSTPRGNFGNFGLYYDVLEILPQLEGCHRYNKANNEINRYSSKEVEVRALVEGQFVGKRAHAEDFGFIIGPNTRIIATGGGSANKSILQVLSDVFASPVYTMDQVNSAMLGSAYLAKWSLHRDKKTFDEITSCLPEPKLVCMPYDDAESIYKPMVERYRVIVEDLLSRKTDHTT